MAHALACHGAIPGDVTLKQYVEQRQTYVETVLAVGKRNEFMVA